LFLIFVTHYCCYFLFTALFAPYCIFKILFSYSAIQPQVCLINSVGQSVSPNQGHCSWILLEAPPSDPHYRLTLRGRHLLITIYYFILFQALKII